MSMLQYFKIDLICIYLVINEVDHQSHGYWPFIGLVQSFAYFLTRLPFFLLIAWRNFQHVVTWSLCQMYVQKLFHLRMWLACHIT